MSEELTGILVTPAEQRLIELLLQGMTRHQSAEKLGVQRASVSTALRTARDRNEIKTNEQLLVAAETRGMTPFRKRNPKPATPYISKPESEFSERSRRIREREAAKRASLLAQMGRA